MTRNALEIMINGGDACEEDMIVRRNNQNRRGILASPVCFTTITKFNGPCFLFKCFHQ